LGIQAARDFLAAQCIASFKLGMRRTKHATRMGRYCTHQHTVKRSPAMPGFNGIEDEFGTVLLADNASHAAIIA
jgi:hypothetical protein